MKILLTICLIFSFTAFAQDPRPIPADGEKEVKAKVGDKEAKKKVAKNKGLALKYRLYGNKKRSKKWVKKFEKQLKWWIKTINKNCKPEKIKFTGFKPLTHDYSKLMFNKHNDSTKKIYKFQTDLVEKPMAPRYAWVKGFEQMWNYLNTRLTDERKTDEGKKIDAQITTFHVPVFKEIYARMRGRDAMIPGIVRSNLLLIETKANLKDMQHEIGHLFGMDDDTGGILTKIRPDGRNDLTGRYDDEDKYGWRKTKVRDYRCKVIKERFGF